VFDAGFDDALRHGVFAGAMIRFMDPDRLNFFQPFENLPPTHENQLTRALLVLLRLSPLAHECWLGHVGLEQHLYQLPRPIFHTQRRAIPLEQDADAEPLPLVSVYLAPGPSLSPGTVVKASDRTQVLDAIIAYPGSVVVVVENKIGDAEDWQAGNINVTGVAVKLAEGVVPVGIAWPTLLRDFIGILERGLVGGAEAQVLSDFLVYVEDHFAGLGPYQTLRLCARSSYRVDRRLRAVLGDALGVEARIDGWGPCCDIPDLGGTGTRAYLLANEPIETISFAVYPADTLTQARQFYTRPQAVEGVRNLIAAPGWYVGHNFHWGHMQAGYAWAHGPLDPSSYLDIWVAEIDAASVVERQEWPEYFDWLVEKQVAVPTDRDEFDRHFTDTSRMTATPRPGLEVARVWQIAEAEDLDERDALVSQVADAFARIKHDLGS
jgi:hypothetical protein